MYVHMPSHRARKKIFFFLFVAMYLVIIVQYRQQTFFWRYMKRIQKVKPSNVRSICHLPDYDLFDPTILKFLNKVTLKCPDEPHLTFVDENGYIHLNKSGFEEANKSIETVHCEFSSFEAVEGKENDLKYGVNRTITPQPIFIDAQFVRVSCEEHNKTVYERVHYFVPPPNKTLQQRNARAKETGRPNVLLLQIDSVSRLGFIRNLPKSYKYLTERLRSVIMKGMNKVGTDTHRNMLPFLSGHRVSPLKPDDGTPTHPNVGGFFDELPLVWNNFSRAGYVTMWFDELATQGMFYLYQSLGFQRKPTDYFLRPLMLMMEFMGLGEKQLCFGSTPTFYFILDYIDKFVRSMKDTVYFAYTSIVKIAHDDPNTLQSVDDQLHHLLERLHNEGDLDNTVLLVFGDHGLRFGPIRETLMGGVEDKMPFMSIYLPRWMREKKPHLQRGLDANSGRLLGWFDMYEMLMDLAMNNLEEVSRVPRWGVSVGLSPFRPLPENRTCLEAGISLDFCVCLTTVEIDVTDDDVLEAAKQLVRYVNSKLSRVPGRPCAELSLAKVESAQVISRARSVEVSHGFLELLRVTVSTLPSGALLQAVVERTASDDAGKVLGEVERINKYGNQSWCVASYPDSSIKTYCYCITNETKY